MTKVEGGKLEKIDKIVAFELLKKYWAPKIL
jgi:hypothetical protein